MLPYSTNPSDPKTIVGDHAAYERFVEQISEMNPQPHWVLLTVLG